MTNTIIAEVIPSMIIMASPLIGSTESRLFKAADDIIEYRMRLSDEGNSNGRVDLVRVITLVQDAAFSCQANDNGAVLDNLKAAIDATDDPDVTGDLRRLICDLGYPCVAHGEETFPLEVRPNNYTGANVDDTINVFFCSYCGKALREFPLQWADLEGERGY